jgi:hypothetical protein
MTAILFGMRRPPRGSGVRSHVGTVATVLMVAVVALMLGLVVASAAVTQLGVSSRLSNADKARNAAESMVQTAIAALILDPEFGTSGVAADDTLDLEFDGATAQLTFIPQDDGPWSINNVHTDTPRYGWERLIPAQAVHLVGVGECNGVERIVEAVVHTPRFPHVITTSGDFEVTGPLEVGVLPRGSDPTTFSLEDLLPGHLASNSSNHEAVKLNELVVVHGDILTSGKAILNEAEVRGELLEGTKAQPVPKIDIRSYDPGFRSDITASEVTGANAPDVLSGWNRSNTDLVLQKGVRLDAGILYVNGSVDIKGPVEGKGAIVATGPITVQGNLDLEADHQVALLSEKDIRLAGQGKFRGLVYTEGNFESDKVKLIGAFVANGKNGSGDVVLKDAGTVVSDPSMSFEKAWLTMERRELDMDKSYWNTSEAGPKPKVYAQSKFLKETDDGLYKVEWTFVAEFQQENGTLSRTSVFHDFYDKTGERVRYEEVIPQATSDGTGAEKSQGINRRAHDHVGNFELSAEIDGVTQGAIRAPEQTPLPAEKVTIYKEVVDFDLDFSQFLAPEERIKILLWVER